MATVTLTRTMFWSMIALGAITLVYLVYSSFDFQGQADRAIIKKDIRGVLGNFTAVLTELQQQELAREIRSNLSQNTLTNLTQGLYDFVNATEVADKKQTEELLPVFRRSFNQTDQMLNATQEMLQFIKFISESFDEEYLIDEVRQYGQSNSTYGNLTITQEKLNRIINLLNATH